VNTNDKIVVLHLCEHFGGQASSLHGVARGFQWWMPRFDADRFRVILCSRKGPDKASEQMIQSGIEPTYLGYGKLDPRNLLALIRLVRREKIDIIHAHGYGACFWGRIAGLLLRLPVVVHERSNYRSVPLFQRPAEFLLGPLTRHAFAVSASTRQFCIDGRHMKPDAVEVLYNGLPLEDIEILGETNKVELRRELGAEQDELIVGVVCRIEPYKGLDDALAAIALVRQTLPKARLWIAGDGTYEATLRDHVQAQGLEDAVRFLGFRSDVRRVIQCFDVQLFPSHQEGTPNTLFEAMAVGNAMVATTTDGQGEILRHEETALMLEAGDTDTMAKNMVSVLTDDALRRRLRDAALARGQDFDGWKCVQRMQEKYEEIMAGRHDRS
jgi:glycosyltransferase involved in cell wall biosynthesis